ncbi:MAG: LuxR C-terminal-related transcriptional regulator [Methylophilus sp.]
MIKQRQLTEIQLSVLTMRLNGKTTNEIASKLGIHPNTVSKKYRAMMRGIAKGAYSNLPAEFSATGDLFKH